MSELTTVDLVDYTRAMELGTLFGRTIAREWRSANPDLPAPMWQQTTCPGEVPAGVPFETWQGLINQAAARAWDKFFDVDSLVKPTPHDRT